MSNSRAKGLRCFTNPQSRWILCSFWGGVYLPGVWILCANVSEHFASSVYMGGARTCLNTDEDKIQTPGNHRNERIRHAEDGESFKSRNGFCPSTKLCEWCKWRICNWFYVKQKLTLYIQYNPNSAKYRFWYSLDNERKCKIHTRYSSCFLCALLNTPLSIIPVSSLPFCVQPSFTKSHCHGTFRDVKFYISPCNKLCFLTTQPFHCVYFCFLRSSDLKRSAAWL